MKSSFIKFYFGERQITYAYQKNRPKCSTGDRAKSNKKKITKKRKYLRKQAKTIMGETKVSLKLLIDSRSKKVLFAEAKKEFVDFLFHIMSLPVGTIVKLLKVKGMVGSLGALYKSIESLSSDYFQPNLNKDSVLKPATVNVPLLSLQEAVGVDTSKVYRCNDSCAYITYCKGTKCVSCGNTMSTAVDWVTPQGGAAVALSSSVTGGYVKGVVTYMVMDNLEVKPMSTISGITLIKKFRVKDVSRLVEKEVELGLQEGLTMLKASLQTNAV